MFLVKLAMVIFCIALGSKGFAQELHSEVITHFYPGPVHLSQAFLDLENAVAQKIKDICQSQKAGIQFLDFKMPSEHGVTFRPDGIPGSTEFPIFTDFSYPEMVAEVKFTCF